MASTVTRFSSYLTMGVDTSSLLTAQLSWFFSKKKSKQMQSKESL
jgi:hypothetical protein